jgi:hypothetical protein
LALIIAVCLAPTLLSLASSFSFAHWHRLLTPDFDSPAVQVVTYGLRCASLIEALAMIALTLWLARRQLMAKA